MTDATLRCPNCHSADLNRTRDDTHNDGACALDYTCRQCDWTFMSYEAVTDTSETETEAEGEEG